MAYAIVRTDNMQGTIDGSKLVSFRYHDGNEYAAIENGMVLTLDSLMPNERELWKAVKPAAGQKLGKLILVAGVELMYDERKRNLDEFINEKDANIRGYVLCQGDTFSVTVEACSATPSDSDKYITVQEDTKWSVSASETDAIAELIAIEQVGTKTYYVFRVL